MHKGLRLCGYNNEQRYCCVTKNPYDMKGFAKGDKVLYNGRVMTVESVTNAKDTDGWQDMVTVTDGGETVEIGEYDCVFAMPEHKVDGDEMRNLYTYLTKNGIYCEIYPAHTRVELLLEWGDWKHDHGFVDYLMGLIGYTFIAQTITEDDGSDCYSAIHTYLKPVAA